MRVSNYAAALGDPQRWPEAPANLSCVGRSPMQYESAHKRRDGGISREGSVAAP
ncbi:transposase [Mycolicibacterium goodii]|uniref:transposase n=1 Tax=Mycolicibacterium goodii TaxID=134601 RepID=UPI00296EBD13